MMCIILYYCLNNFIKFLSISLALARACAPTTGSVLVGLDTFIELEGLSHLLLRFFCESTVHAYVNYDTSQIST